VEWVSGLQLKNSPASLNATALQENSPASLKAPALPNATALQENSPSLPNAPAALLQTNSEIKKVKLAIATQIPDSIINIEKIRSKVVSYYIALYKAKPPREVTRFVYGRINKILEHLVIALDKLNNSSNNNANFEYSTYLSLALQHATKLLELATSPELDLLFRDIYEIVRSTPYTSSSTGNFISIHAKPNSETGSSLGPRRLSVHPNIHSGAGRSGGQSHITAIFGNDGRLVHSVISAPQEPKNEKTRAKRPGQPVITGPQKSTSPKKRAKGSRSAPTRKNNIPQ
jgi:hypothetical protein